MPTDQVRLDPVLRAWETDPAIGAVAIQGTGDRAFCAGGDIRAIYEAGRGTGPDPGLTRDFFREEYRLIRRVHRYAKPYVALIDGITMGGGAGISVGVGRWVRSIVAFIPLAFHCRRAWPLRRQGVAPPPPNCHAAMR